jgi:hypothetical protein
MGTKLAFRQNGLRQVLELDGENISTGIRSVTFTADAGDVPQVTLELVVFELDADTDNARIHVGEESALLLKKLGWTPPEES